jgi:aspartyl-tRNA(Asn)/glutamyl-tRNA(Gln) amidotransferase subunit B
MAWETVIGLEVHVQLATHSKLFSGSATTYGAEPNTQANVIDLGLPGVLPVLNRSAVEMAIKFGLSINGTISHHSVFERKNYFYPDLPKGYQISQYGFPIVSQGFLDVTLEDGVKRIGITRAHLEEDAGKSIHEEITDRSLIDLNRAGTALIEIVSEPDIRSAKEAVAYLKTLHMLVRYLRISNANMQEGSFRCDANVSVRRVGEKQLGIRTEIKNVNSFRFVERAINYEVERQIELIENGNTIIQETRLYDENTNQTRSMRSKEEAMDYRYFPDPDLLPVIIDQAFIDNIRETLPELPIAKQQRFEKDYGLSGYDANILVSSKEMADYFETTLSHTAASPKVVANWIIGQLSASLNKANLDISKCPISPSELATMLNRIVDKTLSGNLAKTVFESLWEKEGTTDDIISQKGLAQMIDLKAIEKIIDDVLAENEEQVRHYHSGKDKLFGFFVGQIMRKTKGKSNPTQVNDLLKKKLELLKK